MSEALPIERKIADKWAALGLTRRPGVPSEELTEFERRYSVVLPAEFRAYLKFVDGMDDEMDDESFRFWPLAEIRPVDQELEPYHTDRYWYPGSFVFADWAICAWLYAIQLDDLSSEMGRIFIVFGGDQRQPPIAASFSEFAERYLHNPTSLFPS